MNKTYKIKENFNPQAYICNDCDSVCWEEDLGSIKTHNYHKLFCTMCGSEEVELVK